MLHNPIFKNFLFVLIGFVMSGFLATVPGANAQAPVCEEVQWSHEFSLAPNQESVGDAERNTYVQIWDGSSIDSGKHIYIAKGFELVLDPAYRGKGSYWLVNADPGLDHLRSEKEVVRQREITNGAPADWAGPQIIVIADASALVPAGFSVRPTSNVSPVLSYDSNATGLVVSEPAPFIAVSEIPFGDSTMFTFVRGLTPDGKAFAFVADPGFDVRMTSIGTVGNKWHISGPEAEVLAAIDGLAQGTSVIRVNSLTVSGLPSGWTIQSR